MIVLSYQLSSEWNARASNIDWSHADETTLRYGAFLGDQTFIVNQTDFSAKWGWVPILDFAACLVEITRGLMKGEAELIFEFTESDAHLQFNRQSDNVLITSNYGSATATVPLRELEQAACSYAERVLIDAINLHPRLKANASLEAWYPSATPGRI
jgi:hypothetical protein